MSKVNNIPSWATPMHNLPIEDFLGEQKSEEKIVEPRSEGQTWRASALGSLCPREEALCAKHGVSRTSEVSADLKVIFTLGHGIHDAIQQRYLGHLLIGGWRCLGCGLETGSSSKLMPRPSRCSGMKYDHKTESLTACPNHNYAEDVVKDWHLPGWSYREVNIRAREPFVIYSHPDGFLWRGPDAPPEEGVEPQHHWVEVLEIKSASSTSFYQGSGGERPVRDSPYESHIKQVQTYLNLLDMEVGRILYVNKSGWGVRSTFASHVVTRDKDWFNEHVVKDVLSVEEAIKTGDELGTRRVCDKVDCERARKCVVRAQCWTAIDKPKG